VSRSSGGALGAESFAQVMRDNALLDPEPGPGAPLGIGGAFPTLKEATGFLVDEALRRTEGNQAQAARLLGISPPALSRRLSRNKDE